MQRLKLRHSLLRRKLDEGHSISRRTPLTERGSSAVADIRVPMPSRYGFYMHKLGTSKSRLRFACEPALTVTFCCGPPKTKKPGKQGRLVGKHYTLLTTSEQSSTRSRQALLVGRPRH